jgi:GDP-4-dehydro-6-deoxy-D-mannose reductase
MSEVKPLRRILVTGASGFVGGHLLAELRAAGHEVWGSVQRPDQIPALGGPGVVLHLEEPESIHQALERTNPDGIVHLAGMASPHLCNTRPETANRINFLGSLRLLEACRSRGRGVRVLMAGSATVYGRVDPGELPLAETIAPRPSDAYSLSKAAQEMLAGIYQAPVEVVATRPFNHTGPGQTPDFALPAFARQLARIEAGLQEAVLKVGDLSPSRDFLHVRDVASAYRILLQLGRAGGVYNISSGSSRTMREWLDLLVERTRVPVKVEVDPYRVFAQGNPRLEGDNSRLRALGWEPAHDAGSMVDDLLEHWRERVRTENE